MLYNEHMFEFRTWINISVNTDYIMCDVNLNLNELKRQELVQGLYYSSYRKIIVF